MQLYLQIQQISADIRDYLQIWQLSAQCLCIPPCHTVASNYWSKQIYLQIWLLSADKVPICRYPSYLQIYRYGENLADIYLQIYRHVYRQIISADWTIGRTLVSSRVLSFSLVHSILPRAFKPSFGFSPMIGNLGISRDKEPICYEWENWRQWSGFLDDERI